jgi:hypothetical protein
MANLRVLLPLRQAIADGFNAGCLALSAVGDALAHCRAAMLGGKTIHLLSLDTSMGFSTGLCAKNIKAQ